MTYGGNSLSVSVGSHMIWLWITLCTKAPAILKWVTFGDHRALLLSANNLMCSVPPCCLKADSLRFHRVCNRSDTSREMAVGIRWISISADGGAGAKGPSVSGRPHPQRSVNRHLHHFGGLRGIRRDRKSINRRVHQNHYRARAAHHWTGHGGFNARRPSDRQQSLLMWLRWAA